MSPENTSRSSPGKPTLSQVAALAGVSLATASNALNRRRGVNANTQAKVFKAAKDTGYLEHWRSQSSEKEGQQHSVRLITYRKHGLIMQDTPFFARLIQGLEACCSELGLDLLFSQIQADSDSDRRKLRLLLQETQVPVLVLATEMHDEDLAAFAHASTRVVMLDRFFPQASFDTVGIANREAGYKAGRYLLEKGHRRLGIIKSSVFFRNMKEREEGFREALSEAGVELLARQAVSVQPTIAGSDHDFGVWLQSNEERPTAFFAGNDAMAVGAMRAMLKQKIKVPQGISILGMDNTSMCQAVHPELSSLHVHKKELARQAVQLLMQKTGAKKGPRLYLQLGVDLIERNSVGLPPQ